MQSVSGPRYAAQGKVDDFIHWDEFCVRVRKFPSGPGTVGNRLLKMMNPLTYSLCGVTTEVALVAPRSPLLPPLGEESSSCQFPSRVIGSESQTSAANS